MRKITWKIDRRKLSYRKLFHVCHSSWVVFWVSFGLVYCFLCLIIDKSQIAQGWLFAAMFYGMWHMSESTNGKIIASWRRTSDSWKAASGHWEKSSNTLMKICFRYRKENQILIDELKKYGAYPSDREPPSRLLN